MAFVAGVLFIAFEVQKAAQVHRPGVLEFRCRLQETGRLRVVRLGPFPLPQQNREVRHAFGVPEAGGHLVPGDRFRLIFRDSGPGFAEDTEPHHGTGVSRHGGFFIPLSRFFVVLRGAVSGLAAEADLVHAVDVAPFGRFPVKFQCGLEVGFYAEPEVVAVTEQEVCPGEAFVRGEAEQAHGLFPVLRDASAVEVQDTEEAVRLLDAFFGRFPVQGGRFFIVPLHAGAGLEAEAQHEERAVVAALCRLAVEFERLFVVPGNAPAEQMQFRQLECRFDRTAVHRRCVAEHRFLQVRLGPDAVLIAGTEGTERQRVLVVRRLFQQGEPFGRVLVGPDAIHIAEPQPVVRFRTARLGGFKVFECFPVVPFDAPDAVQMVDPHLQLRFRVSAVRIALPVFQQLVLHAAVLFDDLHEFG